MKLSDPISDPAAVFFHLSGAFTRLNSEKPAKQANLKPSEAVPFLLFKSQWWVP